MLTWCNSCLIYRALKTESFKSLQFTTLVESSYSQNTWTTMKVEYVSGKSLSLSLSLSLSHTHFVMGCRGLIPQQCPREQQGQLWNTIMVVKSNGQQGIISFCLLVSYTHTQWVLNPQPHPPTSAYKRRRCQLSQTSLAGIQA